MSFSLNIATFSLSHIDVTKKRAILLKTGETTKLLNRSSMHGLIS